MKIIFFHPRLRKIFLVLTINQLGSLVKMNTHVAHNANTLDINVVDMDKLTGGELGACHQLNYG